MIEKLRNDWKIKHFKSTRIMIAWEINYWNTQALDITGAREDNWKFGEKTLGVPWFFDHGTWENNCWRIMKQKSTKEECERISCIGKKTSARLHG